MDETVRGEWLGGAEQTELGMDGQTEPRTDRQTALQEGRGDGQGDRQTALRERWGRTDGRSQGQTDRLRCRKAGGTDRQTALQEGRGDRQTDCAAGRPGGRTDGQTDCGRTDGRSQGQTDRLRCRKAGGTDRQTALQEGRGDGQMDRQTAGGQADGAKDRQTDCAAGRPGGRTDRGTHPVPLPAAGPALPVPDTRSLALLPAGFGVQQLPPTASAPAGGSVTLSCSFPSHNQSGAQVTWARGAGEAVVLDAAHPFYRGRLAESWQAQPGRVEATVTLWELTERDSDLYCCYVSQPQGEQATGAGTALTVTDRAPVGHELCPDSGPLYFRAVASLSLAVLFSLGIILSLRPGNGTGSTRDPAVLPVPIGGGITVG
ncbi:uncharacterized protein LOC142025128 [Carettochelys insculpta]|uniref:uncharacterized protein LOC142025128 n=1 Tax=Carettochelys insculpta TaxID=44489 RepID=UPI003EBEAA28